MTLFDAFLLGVVQGLTEFIPVSSTAHLLIFEKLLGIPVDARLFSFSVIIQLGTVVAMLAFFWKDILAITKAFLSGLYHKKPFEDLNARLGWLIILATIPAGIAGFLLKDDVLSNFEHPFLQAGIRLLVTAVLLTLIEYFSSNNRKRSLDSITWWDALVIGFFQVMAVFPGASRSGTTITGGMLRGFDRPSAARFAFLMSAPILIAASAYETVIVLNMPDGNVEFFPLLFIGFVVSGIVGWLAVKWLINYLGKHSLYGFAAYCAVVGVILLFIELV
jgi:undecaprenyl-diphosphatase